MGSEQLSLSRRPAGSIAIFAKENVEEELSVIFRQFVLTRSCQSALLPGLLHLNLDKTQSSASITALSSRCGNLIFLIGLLERVFEYLHISRQLSTSSQDCVL